MIALVLDLPFTDCCACPSPRSCSSSASPSVLTQCSPAPRGTAKDSFSPPPPAFSLDFTFVLIWLAVNICPRWGSASPWHAVLSGRAVVPLLEAGKPTLLRLVSAREVRCGLQEAAAAHAFFIALDFCLENVTHPTHKSFRLEHFMQKMHRIIQRTPRGVNLC